MTCTFVNVAKAYLRPKGATPMRPPRARLPTVHRRQPHPRPAARVPSCNPPVQVSPLTPGTPDANGAAANMTGSVRLSSRGRPAGPTTPTF